MSVTKDSFRDWKANPVTKAVFNALLDKVGESKDRLGNTAGLDPLQDRYISGAIAAYMDLLKIDFEEVSDGN
jgi:hypothetical protein